MTIGYLVLMVVAICALCLMFWDIITTMITYRQEQEACIIACWELLKNNSTDYERIIINEPAVIYFDAKGRKYVSKAHNESFDAEKGLLMCIAKSKGFNHNRINRMLKDADNKKESE